MNLLCDITNMSRQNFYKRRSVRQKLSVDEDLVLELVHRERALQPRLGTRKLIVLISDELTHAGVYVGRDRMFSIMDNYELLIERNPSFKKTTDSNHNFRVYPNKAKDLVLTAPHQLWVSDITYIRTLEGFMYLCLIMDVYSRFIVGWDCSDSLEMQGALRALDMAIAQRPDGVNTMHHSDCGCQFCSGPYENRLTQEGIEISMTEENHCYENGKAERLNETIKYEYGLVGTLARKSLVHPLASSAINLYNYRRPHISLDYKIPSQVHHLANK